MKSAGRPPPGCWRGWASPGSRSSASRYPRRSSSAAPASCAHDAARGRRHRPGHRHDLGQGRGPDGDAPQRPLRGAADAVADRQPRADRDRSVPPPQPGRRADRASRSRGRVGVGTGPRPRARRGGHGRERRAAQRGGTSVRAGDRLVRSPRQPRDRAGRRESARVRGRVRAHHRPSVVEPGQHRQAAVAAGQRVRGRPGVDLAERARMDRLRPRRRPGPRAVPGFPDRSHRSGHGRVVARRRGDGRAVSPDPARRTAGRRPRGLRAARRGRVLRRGGRADGGRARPSGGGHRRRRGRARTSCSTRPAPPTCWLAACRGCWRSPSARRP